MGYRAVETRYTRAEVNNEAGRYTKEFHCQISSTSRIRASESESELRFLNNTGLTQQELFIYKSYSTFTYFASLQQSSTGLFSALLREPILTKHRLRW